MDRLVYTAMSGAKHTLEQQATASNNLANATTTGFRAQLNTFRSAPVVGDGLPTRAFVVDSTAGNDFSQGPIQDTGRALDVAVQGRGWIAVQTADGGEAYTRNGSFKTTENGILQTQSGQPVLGDGGPITIPPDVTVAIAADGTVSTIPTDGIPNAVNILGRIKLVNPDDKNLKRGDDGMFRTINGGAAQPDANVRLASGALEGSNVNVVEAMVNMINLSRQFEMNMKMIQTAESDATKATQILSLT
ncbi:MULTISPECIES: flagellar basal-body rod protein FlgF [unclassified Herbaspirillum]|uniref:flagellar basal-body rod protein FlgF n=1 Tax=unclassified Herbaspirillum TaxID=2624150 RepID=UPI00114E4ECD|nr:MULTISPECIES: flagellar basal-body rod protein FlgF [unclassified Herbaspirillum]MBB5392911.1 flagellar basal-body rod protein FlgF [Herbaspirillum sp. SJZ102]TQK04443.1 flagellar basal-body rod protein FlgF [Herbaspirillum sp. SJZ130]TQK09772.1 flagellar basal-body rod protein FlgF [Herbaspirillum sp. SJZ106]TWC65878.1 flagellar basal-body rod protein FlgF [Herbaspirillum sp. SJZ099]